MASPSLFSAHPRDPLMETPTLTQQHAMTPPATYTRTYGENEFVFREKPVKIINNYEMHEVLGEGTYGKVRRAIDISTKKQYAIKIIQRKKLRKLRKMEDQLQREISIMKKLNHEHVVSLCDVFECSEKDKLYLVMEFAGFNTVETLLEVAPQGHLSESEARWYARQLVSGLQYCHSRGIIHRDIKPSNLVITAEHVLKITDFGVAETISSEQVTCLTAGWDGSPAFFPPEVANGSTSLSGFKADAWAVGVTLYMMVVGHPPFTGRTIVDLLDNIAEVKCDIPSNLSADLHGLLLGIFDSNEAARFDIDEISMHPWLQTDEAVDFTTLPEELKILEQGLSSLDVGYQNQDGTASPALSSSSAVSESSIPPFNISVPPSPSKAVHTLANMRVTDLQRLPTHNIPPQIREEVESLPPSVSKGHRCSLL